MPRLLAIPLILALLVAASTMGSAGSHPAHAQASPGTAPEGAVKVAFLYNFAQFVEWPPEALGPEGAEFVVCVAGADPFEGAIESLRGKRVSGRAVVWRMVADPARDDRCHILFLSPGEGTAMLARLKQAPPRGVLTVGNEPGFASAGGVINLVRQDTRFRFEVNLRAANQAGLRLSSQLLRLATIVPGE